MAKVPKQLPFTVRTFMNVVKGNLGVVEEPKNSNKTPFGELYAKHTKGAKNGVAWCGIWVWCNFFEAGIDLQKQLGFRWCAYTPTFQEDCKRAGWREIAWKDLQEGDIIFWSFGKKRTDHVSICSGPVKLGRVSSDEGNTSSGVTGSQNNGGGSYSRKRTRSAFKTAYRPPFASANAAKPKPKPKPAGRTITAILAGGAITYGGLTYLPTTGPNAPKPKTVTITKTVKPAPAPTKTVKVTVTVKPTQRPQPGPTVVKPPKKTASPTKPAPKPTVVKRYVVVRRGDSLIAIAQREHTTWQKVAALNGMKKPWTVYPGQKVRVR